MSIPLIKTLCIIPARAGSQRIKNKNVRLLHGIPLFVHTLNTVLEVNEFDHVIVSSDSPEILSYADKYVTFEFLKRPPEISNEKSLAIDFVQHSLKNTNSKLHFDLILIAQVTSPFTSALDYIEAIKLMKKGTWDSLVSVVEVPHDQHPDKFKSILNGKIIPYFRDEESNMASHEMKKVYLRNGSLYISTREVINANKIIGEQCGAYIMPRERSIDINDEVDFKFAEFIMQKGI